MFTSTSCSSIRLFTRPVRPFFTAANNCVIISALINEEVGCSVMMIKKKGLRQTYRSNLFKYSCLLKSNFGKQKKIITEYKSKFTSQQSKHNSRLSSLFYHFSLLLAFTFTMVTTRSMARNLPTPSQNKSIKRVTFKP